MAVRPGMTELISQLRVMTNAGTAEATIGTAVFWSDEQLQERLDRVRVDRVQTLNPYQDYVGGSIVYYRYTLPTANVERDTSGTAAWRLLDLYGIAPGTAGYTIDYDGRSLTFLADQGGTAYSLSYREYNLHRAAAQIWREKAGFVASGYDIETDNHNLKRSQRHAMYLSMARQMESAAGGSSAGGAERRVRRVDVW